VAFLKRGGARLAPLEKAPLKDDIAIIFQRDAGIAL
jgi:hypothetical protein